MKDFTDQDIERIEALIEAHDDAAIRADLAELHPADIAELFQHLNLKQAEWVFDLIEDTEKKADVLMELDEEDRKKLLEGMDPEQISHFIDLLDTDGLIFHRPVYDGFPYTEIPDIILFPVYCHYSRIRGYYHLVEEVFFQIPYAFFCTFREFFAKAVNAPF